MSHVDPLRFPLRYPLGLDGDGRPFTELVELSCYEDSRGRLVPVDFQDLPFTPQRIFFVGDVPVGEVRGRHAHYFQSQAIICLAGCIEVELRAGENSALVTLDAPDLALVVWPRVWSAQRFMCADSVELVLASGPYERQGYSLEW